VQRVFNKQGMITTIVVRVGDVSRIAAVTQEMEKIPDIQVVAMSHIMEMSGRGSSA
jgi:hypothetical protein